MADVPFKGEFKMATEATGAESGTDYSANFVSMMPDPQRAAIDFGPYLADNFTYQQPGPTSCPFTLTLEGLTQTQILALHANFAAGDLMECKYMPLAGTIDTPTTSNAQWTVQFYFLKPPPIPTVVGEKARFEMSCNARAAKLDDGANPVTYGTLTAT